ncbi:MAG TPA: hypothetical protein PKY82_01240 [Pyrinomonadaceae bacterium]|nr:hypothetical protein [Pyrinomonadaceae bacterium]
MNENLTMENENSSGETTVSPETIETLEQSKTNGETNQPQTTETVATTAIIKIEGQEIPLDVSIAADDNLLKAALSPYYPSIKNAQISRETRVGQMIVSIVKKAEHKGESSEQSRR